MIEKVSEMLAFRLKSINPEETASVEVMKFSLSVLINFAAIVFLSLFISAFLGTFTSTLTALVALATLRAVSGGFHLPVSEYCVAASTALFLLIPYIPVNSKWCILLNIAACLLILIYAPSRIEQQSRIPEKYYPHLKIISLLIVCINFWVMSGVLAVTFFAQSLLLIRKLSIKT